MSIPRTTRVATWIATTALAVLASAPARGATAAQAEALARLLSDRPVTSGVAAVAFASSADRWKRSGVRVSEGESLTLFGFGEGVGARVWVRIGDADIVNLGESTWSFPAWASGEVELAVRPQGQGINWERCDGTLPAAAAAAAALAAEPLDLAVVVAAWKSPVAEALAAFPEHEAVARAKSDLEATLPLPAGFRSICYLRRTNVFQAWEGDGRRGLWGHAASSAGIIKKAVDLPLDPQSEITFEWRHDALHSLGPETEARHHDYSSIAVEFDNGQDITWLRSPHLEAGTSFACPLAWWNTRETHIVLQGGRDDLGVWQRHTRNLLDDYDMAVGDRVATRPTRIVGVWFISVGAFGGTTPDTKYANVVLRSGGRSVEVFETR
ncbi:MAG TPA: DUF3047 domain-containing protein [Thermoanaerobaculia bacterium]|nr:DUF3047 domain-containing protein [Thermoanaerobaculia bacterium]